jgi:hypothetical protein
VEVAKSWWSSAKETASEWGKALDAKRIESREKFGPAPQGGLLGEVVDRSPAASGNAFLVMTASGPGRAPARAIVEKELAAPAPAAPVAPLGEAGGGTARALPSLSEAVIGLGRMDARVLARAAELAGEGGSGFPSHLSALSRATTEAVGPHGQVHLIGELGGKPIFGSLVSRVGIVGSEQGTLLVRASAGEAVQVLGLFK